MKYNIDELDNKLKNITNELSFLNKKKNIYKNSYLTNNDKILELYLLFIFSGFISYLDNTKLNEYDVD